MRFPPVFVSIRMTVGVEMDFTTFRAISSAASKRNVHQACPDGSLLLASWIRRASFSLSRIGARGGCSRFLTLQGRFGPLLHETSAQYEHGSRDTGECLCSLCIAPIRSIRIDLQQHIGMLDLVRHRFVHGNTFCMGYIMRWHQSDEPAMFIEAKLVKYTCV